MILLLISCTIIAFSFICIKFSMIPENIMLFEGEQQLYNMRLPINVDISTSNNDVVKLNGSHLNGDKVKLNLGSPFKIETNKNGKVDLDIELLGFLPLKHVTVNVLPQIKVIPGGSSVGVKLNTKGVMVVGISAIECSDGKQYNPSLEAGIEAGDVILKINDVEVKDGVHVSNLVGKSSGKVLKLTIMRKDKEVVLSVKPVKSKEDQKYKIGAWIRDSTAGVGTLTFYDPKTNIYGALGHPITDVDTGVILTVETGTIVPAKIISIQPGIKGRPGELRGLFIDGGEELGNIEKNTSCGIYGKANKTLTNNASFKEMPICLQGQIKEGPAKILTTINGTDVKAYDVVIEKLTVQSKPNPKSMIIRVTDDELLKKTGGIVQGMSGSPIIQDDKIVGAITHVFINRPDMGYGIYIEWMLNEAGIN